MNKKTIFKGSNRTKGHDFEEHLELSSPTNTNKILIKLGAKKIYLNIDTAEELAHQIHSDVEHLRNKENLE